MANGYAIEKWAPAQPIYDELKELTSKPIYCVSDEALKEILAYFDEKLVGLCTGSLVCTGIREGFKCIVECIYWYAEFHNSSPYPFKYNLEAFLRSMLLEYLVVVFVCPFSESWGVSPIPFKCEY